ncbi:MAG: molybdopterin-synthase adenylyltransferase MoeB [Cyclobacteriaceae bacterium]|nr:molybdopterin-synthase adenylyltransferase MoeB [Cyclobacteriaceae bacterium]
MNNTGDQNFSNEELIRYSRHFVLPDFGSEGQRKLKNSTVIVIGAGGLGCPVLLYLAAAGVDSITIIDDDVVSLSNLQRQILFTTDDLNLSKAETAAKKISSLNPSIKVGFIRTRLSTENALTLLAPADVVVDCTDNFPTRYLLNDACVLLDKPLVYGSVFRYEGQVAVFNYKQGVNYRDFYPIPPDPQSVPNCEEGGVLGVLTGIIGSIQANETLKILAGFGEPLSGYVLIFDSMTLESLRIKIADQNSRKSIKTLINYDEFCGAPNLKQNPTMKEVTVQELKALKDSGAEFQLIDVREPHEFDICNLDGELIPQGEIPSSVERVSKNKQVVIYCRSGARSGNMVQWLEKNHGFTNLYNLKGGVLAWAKEIDPSMPTY